MGKRILVVEGSIFMRKIMEDILQQNGYEVAGATGSYVEALRLAKTLAPDIVITDVLLQETERDSSQSGITLTKEILQQDPAAVVFLTTMTQDAIRRDALAAGAKGVISKDMLRPSQRLLDELEKVLNA